MNNQAEAVLKDREQRNRSVIHLSETSGMPVVCGRVNYPGCIKTTQEAMKAFRVLKTAMIASLRGEVRLESVWEGPDGSALLLAVDLPATRVKEAMIALEERHPLGRFFDIDVMDELGTPMTRGGFGMPARTCLLCNDPALECMITQKHTYQELISYVNQTIISYSQCNVCGQ